MKKYLFFFASLIFSCVVSAQEKNPQSSVAGFKWAEPQSSVEQKIITNGGVIFNVADDSISASIDYFGEEAIVFVQFKYDHLCEVVIIYSCNVSTYIKKYKQINALLTSQFGEGKIIGSTTNWLPFKNIKVRSQISSEDQTVSIWYTNTDFCK